MPNAPRTKLCLILCAPSAAHLWLPNYTPVLLESCLETDLASSYRFTPGARHSRNKVSSRVSTVSRSSWRAIHRLLIRDWQVTYKNVFVSNARTIFFLHAIRPRRSTGDGATHARASGKRSISDILLVNGTHRESKLSNVKDKLPRQGDDTPKGPQHTNIIINIICFVPLAISKTD